MCLHHPYFLFLFFKCNIVVINTKFKFTYSKGWQLVSVIEIFPVDVIVFWPASFFLHVSCHYLLAAYLFSFQCQLDAQYNLQQAFWDNVFFRKLFDCLFIPCFELTLLKHLFYLSSRLIIIRFAATRRCFRTWYVVKVGKFDVIGIRSWSWCSWRRTYKIFEVYTSLFKFQL